jgi:hypothetical protein
MVKRMKYTHNIKHRLWLFIEPPIAGRCRAGENIGPFRHQFGEKNENRDIQVAHSFLFPTMKLVAHRFHTWIISRKRWRNLKR